MRHLLSLSLLLIGAAVNSQTFTSNPNQPINDNTTNNYYLNVSGLSPANIDTSLFGLETVCINLTHTWDADLDIFIIAPDGTSALLTSAQGGAGDDYTHTCFNTNVSQTLSSSAPPFTGTFVPMGQMGLVNNGQNGNGTWTLRVNDTYAADMGTMISFSLTFGNNPASYFSFGESDLPIFVINTNSQSIPDEPKIMADLGVIWNGNGNRNHTTDPFNHYDGKCGIETRGASSSNFAKKSYDLELRDVNGFDIDSALCGFPKESDWVLSAQYTDKTLMRGMLTFHLFNELGWYAPRCKHVELLINGEYLGVYVLMEKVKRENDRVDVANLQPTDIYGDQLTGGYIIKMDYNSGSSDPGWASQYTAWPTGDSIHFNYYYPDGATIVPQQAAYIRSYVDSFETALIGPNYMDSALGYRNFVDINSAVDAFIIQELTKSVDAYRKSFYLYKDKDSDTGKLVLAPIWDYDLTYGNCGFCEGEQYDGWQYNFNYVCPGDYWKNPFWFERMRQDSLFNNQVRCRWEELRQTVLADQYLDDWIDSVASDLNESQGWNFTVWPIMGTYVWPNYYIGQSYQEEVDTLKWWIHERLLWMDANIGGTLNSCNLTGIPATGTATATGSAFPNPFSNQVNFSVYLPNGGDIKVTVINSLGQEVIVPMQIAGVHGENRVQVLLPDDLAAGMYVMRIEAAGRFWTQEIMKSE